MSSEDEKVTQEQDEPQARISRTTLVDHMDISVVEAEKRVNGPLALKEHYTVYLIETKVTDPAWQEALCKIGNVWRRYSEFEALRSFFEETYPHCIIPPLPEKQAQFLRQSQSADNLDPLFVDRRRVAFESFLIRVASHPVLCRDPLFMKFLQLEQHWLSIPADSGYLHSAEAKIKALSIGVRLQKPDPKFDAVKSYSTEMQSNLNNILKLRVRQCDRLYGLHKLHANYGRVFSEWSALEKSMGDGLQKAGHFMDSYAAYIESHLEEEEQVTDQLKEYLYFGQALQELCVRHQAMQLEVEKAHNLVGYKSGEKERLDQSKGSMTSRLAMRSLLMSKFLGAPDSEEARQAKLESLEQQISNAEHLVEESSRRLSEFTTLAETDIEHFELQKIPDIHETLSNLALSQIRLFTKGLQTWTHIKEALNEMA